MAVVTVAEALLRDGTRSSSALNSLSSAVAYVGSTVVPTASAFTSGVITRLWFAFVPEVPKNDADEDSVMLASSPVPKNASRYC